MLTNQRQSRVGSLGKTQVSYILNSFDKIKATYRNLKHIPLLSKNNYSLKNPLFLQVVPKSLESTQSNCEALAAEMSLSVSLVHEKVEIFRGHTPQNIPSRDFKETPVNILSGSLYATL